MNRELHVSLARQLTDQGQLIEVGWQVFENVVVPEQAGAQQRTDMRAAFFAGAQHLFASITGMLDSGNEPTAADLRRMDAINRELTAFADEMKLRLQRPGGTA